MERAGLGIEVTVHIQDDCDVCASKLLGATNNEEDFCMLFVCTIFVRRNSKMLQQIMREIFVRCLFVCLYDVCALELQIGAINNEGELLRQRKMLLRKQGERERWGRAAL